MCQSNYLVLTITLAVISLTTAVSQPFWNNNGGSSFDGGIQRGGPFGGVLPNNPRSDFNNFADIQNGGIQNNIQDVNGLGGDRFSDVSTDQLGGAANDNLFGGFKSGDIFNGAPSGDFSSGISNGADFVSSGLSPNDYFGGIPNGNTFSGPLGADTPASNFLAEIPNGIPRNDAILGGDPLSRAPSGGIPNGNHAAGIPNANFLRPRIGIPVGPLPNRNPLSGIPANNYLDDIPTGVSGSGILNANPSGNLFGGPSSVGIPDGNQLARIPATDFLRGDPRNGIPAADYLDDIPTGVSGSGILRANPSGNPFGGPQNGGIPNGNHAAGIPNTNFLRPRIGIPVGPFPNRNPLNGIPANNYLDDIPTDIPEGGNQFGGPQNGGFPGADQLPRIPATDYLRGDPRVGIPAAQYLDDIPTGANPSGNPFGGPQNGGFPSGDQLARIPATDYMRGDLRVGIPAGPFAGNIPSVNSGLSPSSNQLRDVPSSVIPIRGIPSRGIPSRGIPSSGIQGRGIPGIYYLDDIPSRDFSEPLREIPRSGPSGNPLRSLLNRGIPNRGIQNRGIPGVNYLDDIPSGDFSAVVDPLRGIPRSSLLRASPSGNPFSSAPSGSIPSRGIPDGNPLRNGNIGGDRFGRGEIPSRDDLLDNISRDELLASIFADDILEKILDSDIMSGIENSNQFSGGIRSDNLGRISPSGFFGGARRR